MTRDEIASMFERRRVAMERHDVATLMLDYSDDCVVESPIAGHHVGREAIQHAMQGVFDALDLRLHQQTLVIDDPSVAVAFDMEGKDVGEFLGLPPTGKSFRVPIVFLYELKDDKIVNERRIYDFTGMLVQAGLLKAKPAV